MTPRTGVWFAYQSDWSGFAIFSTEIDALRHAVQLQMHVGFLAYGADRNAIQESQVGT